MLSADNADRYKALFLCRFGQIVTSANISQCSHTNESRRSANEPFDLEYKLCRLYFLQFLLMYILRNDKMKGTYKVPKATLPCHLEQRKTFRFDEIGPISIFCHKKNFPQAESKNDWRSATLFQGCNMLSLTIKYLNQNTNLSFGPDSIYWHCLESVWNVPQQYINTPDIIYLSITSYNLSKH